MKKIIVKLIVLCMIVCSVLTTKTENYSAKTLDGKSPIQPVQYQKILGRN